MHITSVRWECKGGWKSSHNLQRIFLMLAHFQLPAFQKHTHLQSLRSELHCWCLFYLFSAEQRNNQYHGWLQKWEGWSKSCLSNTRLECPTLCHKKSFCFGHISNLLLTKLATQVFLYTVYISIYTFESLDQILWCCHSNKKSSAVLSLGTIYLVCIFLTFESVDVHPMVLPFKWNLFNGTFTWYY